MGEEEEEKKKQRLWPKIEDDSIAMELAKGGKVGGLVMVASLIIAVLLVYFTGKTDIIDATSSEEFFYIVQGILIAIAAFLTWRVSIGRGLISSIVLLVWLIFEVSLKAVGGQLNAGWALAWFYAILTLVHSVRGHFALRKYRKRAEA